ncbi:MAG: DUF211 domain-containing protein [Proteobacteria bacterium]|nr:DUF211 domain-containing protein [Pseudomonadota bacterium]MBU1639658.1 DUF211 domain-containing protein [Pseudomonadota bacterium]
MAKIRRLVLDILKPHQPNAVEFACYLADLTEDARFKLTVTAVDKKTENIMLEVEGSDLQFDILSDGIRKQGASIHSIDEVDVDGSPAP